MLDSWKYDIISTGDYFVALDQYHLIWMPGTLLYINDGSFFYISSWDLPGNLELKRIEISGTSNKVILRFTFGFIIVSSYTSLMAIIHRIF